MGLPATQFVFGRKNLGLAADEPYFNAGVLLLNLNLWRGQNILPVMMAHLQENIDRYSANDQDLLNDFFRGQVLRLPIHCNVQGTHLAYTTKDYFSTFSWGSGAYYTQEEVENGRKNPKVVHFFRYLDWKERSLWRDMEAVPPNKKLLFRIEKLLYRTLPAKYFLKAFHFVKQNKR